MIAGLLHIAGTLFLLVAFFLITGTIDGYKSRRRLDSVLRTAAVRLCVSHKELLEGNHRNQLARYLSKAYSTDTLGNRLSDLFRPGLVGLEVISYLSQLGVVILAAWRAVTVDNGYAASAWIAFPIAVFFWMLIMLASVLCYLFTGRAPGEARDARKLVAELTSESQVIPGQWM